MSDAVLWVIYLFPFTSSPEEHKPNFDQLHFRKRAFILSVLSQQFSSFFGVHN
jgi:hypothetical protein